MSAGQKAHRSPVEVIQALEREAATARHFGKGFETVPSESQLAGPENPGMACQDLLDERGARPRHANDEDGPLRIQTPPAHPREELGGERREQTVDEQLVRRRVESHPAPPEIGLLQRVGLRGELGGASELAPSVKHLRQAE